jgi:hypothetical protein
MTKLNLVLTSILCFIHAAPFFNLENTLLPEDKAYRAKKYPVNGFYSE